MQADCETGIKPCDDLIPFTISWENMPAGFPTRSDANQAVGQLR